MSPATDPIAEFLGGFTAAEGSFVCTGSRPRFRFAIGLGATDAAMCELFRTFLEVGRVWSFPRRKSHHDDEVTFGVQSLPELVEVVVPFMDEHLPESHKRQQYLEWRAALLDYWEHRARRGRATCTVDGCTQPVRAHRYCRHHLWVRRRQ